MIGSPSSAASWGGAADAVRQAAQFARPSLAPDISLTDAAEEMAQFFSEARLQERSLKDREVARYESPALERVEQVEALLSVLWSDESRNGREKNQRDARLLGAQLLASAGDSAALDRTLKSFNGSTERFLLLSHALAQAQAGDAGNPVLEVLRDRIDVLWARDGVRIRADVNTAPELPAAEDRQAYRDAVLDGGTLPRTLTLLLSRYGDDIEAAIARLRQALGADLSAMRPSLPVERLRGILNELFLMGALLPFLKNCRDLSRRARLLRRKDRDATHSDREGAEQQGEDEADVDEGAGLLGELAEWVPRWLTLGDVRSLLYQYRMSLEPEAGLSAAGRAPVLAGATVADAMNELDRLLIVLHGVRSILRQVPDRLFPDGEHKLNADQVLASLLDDLILGESDASDEQTSA